MRRKIGFISLAVAAVAFLMCAATMSSFDHGAFTFFMLVYGAAVITAIVCLAGDVIRFIGKCFAQGYNAGTPQKESRVCPNCNKPVSSDARFCTECGCELAKKP